MAVFLTSVSSIVVIVLIMALGFLLRKFRWFGDDFAKSISGLITKIALPASIFVSVQKHLTRSSLVGLGKELIFPALGVIIGYLIAWLVVKVLKVRPGRRGIMMNAIVNANTIFIGMPLNMALFGTKSMADFLIYYVINTVSTWAFGVFLIYNDDPTADKDSKKKHKISLQKLLPMPLVGFVVAIIWLLLGLPSSKPDFLFQTLGYVGNLVTPLSLIYIGVVLCDAGLKNFKFDRDSIIALLGRFVLSPLVLILLIKFGAPILHFDLPRLMQQTLIVQSATPMLAVLPVLAGEAHGDVEYATNVVVMSTVLFIVVVPVLMGILQFI
ncbi:AEC family transporter [Ligilactobacillus aviarius]|uniref:AEC family transporter n=1 Tax=Ligilactobacillus aviarius TaxID=1606 RepID=UPI0032080154